MAQIDYKEFRKNILKVSKPRKHKITKSLGVYDAYKWIRKNKWLDIGCRISEHQFYGIIRGINELYAKELSLGSIVKFPHKMGQLEVRKHVNNISFKNNKLVTDLPIDWDKTLKLWYEEPYEKLNKTLIRQENKQTFRVFYNRLSADYNNKGFYEFKINREIKRELKHNITTGVILDAFLYNGIKL